MAGAISLARGGRDVDWRGMGSGRGILEPADGFFALAEELLQPEEVRRGAAKGFTDGARGGAAEGAALTGRSQPGDCGLGIDMDSCQ
jgi:hypothetical protein